MISPPSRRSLRLAKHGLFHNPPSRMSAASREGEVALNVVRGAGDKTNRIKTPNSGEVASLCVTTTPSSRGNTSARRAKRAAISPRTRGGAIARILASPGEFAANKAESNNRHVSLGGQSSAEMTLRRLERSRKEHSRFLTADNDTRDSKLPSPIQRKRRRRKAAVRNNDFESLDQPETSIESMKGKLKVMQSSFKSAETIQPVCSSSKSKGVAHPQTPYEFIPKGKIKEKSALTSSSSPKNWIGDQRAHFHSHQQATTSQRVNERKTLLENDEFRLNRSIRKADLQRTDLNDMGQNSKLSATNEKDTVRGEEGRRSQSQMKSNSTGTSIKKTSKSVSESQLKRKSLRKSLPTQFYHNLEETSPRRKVKAKHISEKSKVSGERLSQMTSSRKEIPTAMTTSKCGKQRMLSSPNESLTLLPEQDMTRPDKQNQAMKKKRRGRCRKSSLTALEANTLANNDINKRGTSSGSLSHKELLWQLSRSKKKQKKSESLLANEKMTNKSRPNGDMGGEKLIAEEEKAGSKDATSGVAVDSEIAPDRDPEEPTHTATSPESQFGFEDTVPGFKIEEPDQDPKAAPTADTADGRATPRQKKNLVQCPREALDEDTGELRMSSDHERCDKWELHTDEQQRRLGKSLFFEERADLKDASSMKQISVPPPSPELPFPATMSLSTTKHSQCKSSQTDLNEKSTGLPEVCVTSLLLSCLSEDSAEKKSHGLTSGAEKRVPSSLMQSSDPIFYKKSIALSKSSDAFDASNTQSPSLSSDSNKQQRMSSMLSTLSQKGAQSMNNESSKQALDAPPIIPLAYDGHPNCKENSAEEAEMSPERKMEHKLTAYNVGDDGYATAKYNQCTPSLSASDKRKNNSSIEELEKCTPISKCQKTEAFTKPRTSITLDPHHTFKNEVNDKYNDAMAHKKEYACISNTCSGGKKVKFPKEKKLDSTFGEPDTSMNYNSVKNTSCDDIMKSWACAVRKKASFQNHDEIVTHKKKCAITNNAQAKLVLRKEEESAGASKVRKLDLRMIKPKKHGFTKFNSSKHPALVENNEGIKSWTCDVCKKVSFEDYDEAVAHERKYSMNSKVFERPPFKREEKAPAPEKRKLDPIRKEPERPRSKLEIHKARSVSVMNNNNLLEQYISPNRANNTGAEQTSQTPKTMENLKSRAEGPLSRCMSPTKSNPSEQSILPQNDFNNELIKRWTCDVCKKATFEDYYEAADHERECAYTNNTQIKVSSSDKKEYNASKENNGLPNRKQIKASVEEVFVRQPPRGIFITDTHTNPSSFLPHKQNTSSLPISTSSEVYGQTLKFEKQGYSELTSIQNRDPTDKSFPLLLASPLRKNVPKLLRDRRELNHQFLSSSDKAILSGTTSQTAFTSRDPTSMKLINSSISARQRSDVVSQARARVSDSRFNMVIAEKQYQEKMAEYGRLELEARVVTERMHEIEHKMIKDHKHSTISKAPNGSKDINNFGHIEARRSSSGKSFYRSDSKLSATRKSLSRLSHYESSKVYSDKYYSQSKRRHELILDQIESNLHSRKSCSRVDKFETSVHRLKVRSRSRRQESRKARISCDDVELQVKTRSRKVDRHNTERHLLIDTNRRQKRDIKTPNFVNKRPSASSLGKSPGRRQKRKRSPSDEDSYCSHKLSDQWSEESNDDSNLRRGNYVDHQKDSHICLIGPPKKDHHGYLNNESNDQISFSQSKTADRKTEAHSKKKSREQIEDIHCEANAAYQAEKEPGKDSWRHSKRTQDRTTQDEWSKPNSDEESFSSRNTGHSDKKNNHRRSRGQRREESNAFESTNPKKSHMPTNLVHNKVSYTTSTERPACVQDENRAKEKQDIVVFKNQQLHEVNPLRNPQYWLAGGENSSDDDSWDFDGPMILPPPPI